MSTKTIVFSRHKIITAEFQSHYLFAVKHTVAAYICDTIIAASNPQIDICISSNFLPENGECRYFVPLFAVRARCLFTSLKRREGKTITTPTDVYKHQNTGKNKLKNA